MADPTINFVGSALVEGGGQILPLDFHSPYVIAWVFRGNVPPQNWHIGWIQPIVNSDIGENVGSPIQNLYIGQRKLFFPIYPFSPPFKIEVIPKSWITQLQCQFYEVIPPATEPVPDPDPNSTSTTP